MPTTYVSDLDALMDKLNVATAALRSAGGEVPAFVEHVVDDLDADLHADSPRLLDVDPYLTTALFAAALRSMKALRHDNADTRYRDLRIALEQVRHAVRDIIDTAPFGEDEPIGEVARRLVESVKVAQADIAGILGVSTRQLQRWLAGETEPTGEDAARLRIVARIANQLRHAFTAPGVLIWFGREHPGLNAAPLELLGDPLRYPELVAAARRSRTTLG